MCACAMQNGPGKQDSKIDVGLIKLSNSGALRPLSSTKMVILILNGNGLCDHLQIWHLEITFA